MRGTQRNPEQRMVLKPFRNQKTQVPHSRRARLDGKRLQMNIKDRGTICRHEQMTVFAVWQPAEWSNNSILGRLFVHTRGDEEMLAYNRLETGDVTNDLATGFMVIPVGTYTKPRISALVPNTLGVAFYDDEQLARSIKEAYPDITDTKHRELVNRLKAALSTCWLNPMKSLHESDIDYSKIASENRMAVMQLLDNLAVNDVGFGLDDASHTVPDDDLDAVLHSMFDEGPSELVIGTRNVDLIRDNVSGEVLREIITRTPADTDLRQTVKDFLKPVPDEDGRIRCIKYYDMTENAFKEFECSRVSGIFHA